MGIPNARLRGAAGRIAAGRIVAGSIVAGSLAAAVLATVAAIAAGCGSPKYPNCDTDEQCAESGRKGVCVNHTCVECRSDAACGAGKTCTAGACTPTPGFCDETKSCAGGGDCKDHRCQEKVATKAPLECDGDHPCKTPGDRCENNHCVTPPHGGPGCTDFPAPTFDFESPDLKPEGRASIERLAKCLTSGSLKGARVLLTGHCDNRGESEFNMTLGAQRSEAVRGFLVGLGVPGGVIATSSRGELDASGTDDAGWAHDRRVDIEVR